MTNTKAVNALLQQVRDEIGQEYGDQIADLRIALARAEAGNRDVESAFLARVDKRLTDLPDDAPYYGAELRTHWATIRSLATKELS